MPEAYVTGVGFHPFGKFPEKTLKQIAAQAALAALEDAGLGPDGIDAAFCANAYAGLLSGQESVRGETWLRTIAVGAVPIINVENACASGGAAVHLATMAVSCGTYSNVLVVGAEKMFGDTDKAIQALATSSDIEATSGIGLQFSGVDAIRTKQLMQEENLDADALEWVTVKSHANGALNPNAQFRRQLTALEVRQSRMIADPIRLYMCSAISDGAAACVISGHPRKGRRVRITASAAASAPVRVRQGTVSTTTIATRKAYNQAAIGPADLNVVEVHDAVSPLELLYYRDLGLCNPGEVKRFLAEGRAALHGSIPVNPSGGINSRGHPVGATGVAQICEIAIQIAGEAGQRQVAHARKGLALSAGGWIGDDPAFAAVHILEGV